FDAIFMQPVDAATKIYRFADHYGADSELSNQAAAIPAGRQRGHHDFVAVGTLAAGTAERISLSVNRRIIFLNPSIMPAAEQLPVTIKESGADRDTAL